MIPTALNFVLQISPDGDGYRAEVVVSPGGTPTAAFVLPLSPAQPLHPLLEGTVFCSLHEAIQRGIHWHYSRPPIADLEYEMDLCGVRVTERL